MKRRIGIIAAVCIAATVIVVAHNGQRKVYTPVNLMGAPAVEALNANIIPAPTVILTEVAANLPPVEPISPLPTNTALGIALSGTVHTVQAGETLYRIAIQYNLLPEEVAHFNGITELTMIYEGQTLSIPESAIPIASVPTLDSSSVALPSPTESLSDLGILATYIPMRPPPSGNVNRIPIDTIAVMPEGVIQHIRNIYAIGQSLGRNPRAFSKLGDSTIENPHFLARFDEGAYNLGEYGYLQGIISFYVGSFGRQGAVRRGLHTWSVLDPMWAGGPCQAGENLLACELRIQNPSVLIMHLGSNDAGVPEATERNFREIVEFCMANGVIPILGTKADRHEGSNVNNEMIRRIAFEYNLPLWDFDVVAATIPGRGLDQDGVHMTSFFAHDWSSPTAYERGYGLMNLTALIALDKVWRAVMQDV
jgi:LysM repeat protein